MSVTTAIAANAPSLSAIPGTRAPSGPGTDGAAPFANLFRETVAQVDTLETQAQTAIRGLMSGSGVDVHQAVIAAQKADMAFELALSVRNKAMQAYQSVMGMQF